jgi:RES domain-containing protein
VYAAENRALAVLESLVHVQPHRVPADLVVLSVEIPSGVPQETWTVGEFPAEWLEIGAEWCLDRGDAWLDSGAAAVLWVPSAILPAERNAILNPRHPSHPGIRIIDRKPFSFDARLLALTAGRAGPRIHR